MAQEKTKVYTVSEINSLIKAILENNLPGRLTITGEITNWSIAGSGHAYFALKDENAQLPAVMWASNFRKVKFQPENGLAIFAKGYIDVYTPGGKYQFYVESMEPAGIGALQLAFEQMVRKLRAEGLFDEEPKSALPPYPERIGILTSESGAAVQDIADSIYNRWPVARLFLYPVPVQGEGAAEAIAEAINSLNRRNRQLKLDVLIVGRGGGSLEDLWAFNEELLARAIFASQIPVISAVGHEVDVTIADLVADARASTPTKAGVIAVPDAQEITAQLVSFQSRLESNVKAQVHSSQQNLETILASAVFRNPLLPVLAAAQKLDETTTALQDSVRLRRIGLRDRLSRFYEQVIKLEPHRLLGQKTVQLNILANSLRKATESITNELKLQLTARENRLASLNPKSVLKRGYSITTNTRTAKIVTSSADVEINDLLLTELAEENLIESKVTNKQNRNK